MKLLNVAYGSHETFLRNWHETDGWLKGIECNEYGVGDRHGCTDAELWIATHRIVQTHEVEAKELL